MSRTFLQLCQQAVSDLGIAGGVLSTAEGNTNRELYNMCLWVAQADYYVQTLWNDWDFLWQRDDLTLSANAYTVTPSTTMNTLDKNSVCFNPGSAAGPTYPKWMRWPEFRYAFDNRARATRVTPASFSLRPDGTLVFSDKASADLPTRIEYWKQPVQMTVNGDTSPIPSDLDLVIVERAKITYAIRENAPEILSGASAVYSDVLDKLQSRYLPGRRADRMSSNDSTTMPEAYVE